ncbi:putative membrane protein [Aliiruegeria haliotis]|uniref:Putative membrane protein n=1 Tax=Aliiruegeria haliotis TaxID=1280846 RepID=A0A2T0RF44_9RHOB|nr:DUF1269 domain-containing protein [Aliiruegeria haliotis]PRY19788.1 putative membrane protein [Aliiruegeria haliotis]
MNLVALMMDDVETARKARDELANMSRDSLVRLEDAVVAYKDTNGDVKLDQAVNLTATGALGGAWWGLFLGAVFGLVAGVPAAMLAGAAGGAAGGALGGAFSDAGVSDEMMKETSAALDDGKAILFVLGRTEAPEKVAERLRTYGGTVVTSNLPKEIDEKINNALKKAA